MSKPKLALIPSGYKSGKVYSILPNDATGDFDFDRASEGTRVRKDGLIEEVTNNVPRLDWYNSNCPSLLLEPQRTNYATNNTSMDTYNIVGGSNPSPTLTANYITAPDGTLTATRLQASVTGTNYSLIGFPTTALDGSGGGYYTASVYVKSNTGSSQEIAFYGASSAPNNRTISTEWSRIQFTGERLANTKYAYLGTINATDDDIDISVWGAQIELVDSYPSSLIYTGASAVTRLKDECYINSGIDNIINTDEGTLYFEVETPRVSTSSDFDRVVLSDQTATTDRVIFDNFNGNWRVVLTSSAGTQTASIRSVQANTKIKVAFTYSASQIKVSYDGNDATTTSITYTPASTLESFKFSNASNNGQFFQGKIHEVRYFDTILSNAELKELTL